MPDNSHTTTGLICPKCGFAKIIHGKSMVNKIRPEPDCDWPLRDMTYQEVHKYEQYATI